jgi:hypothetical protein
MLCSNAEISTIKKITSYLSFHMISPRNLVCDYGWLPVKLRFTLKEIARFFGFSLQIIIPSLLRFLQVHTLSEVCDSSNLGTHSPLQTFTWQDQGSNSGVAERYATHRNGKDNVDLNKIAYREEHGWITTFKILKEIKSLNNYKFQT